MNSADREQAKILGQYLKESAKNPTLDHYPEELVRRWIELADLAIQNGADERQEQTEQERRRAA